MPIANFDLTNRVAIITGASRGIGEATARAFTEQGATVVLTSRRQESLDKVAASINESGGKAIPIACHNGKPEEMKILFSRVERELGGLDILVNNAATNVYYGPGIDAPESTIDKTFEVNLKGYFLMIQMAAKLMKKRGKGAIINIASIAGIKASMHEMAYSATKAGVISLTKGFAKELGPEIRVNCIAPGLIQTRLSAGLVDNKEKVAEFIKRYPLKRLGQPNDIAPAVVYLASDASSFMTGSVMVIDGGTMA